MLAATDIEKTVNKEKTLMGRYINGKTKKNQTAFHPRTIKTPLFYKPRVRVDHNSETYWCGVEYGVIVDEDGKAPKDKKMAFFGDIELGAGAFYAASFLDKYPDIREAIARQVLQEVSVVVEQEVADAQPES